MTFFSILLAVAIVKVEICDGQFKKPFTLKLLVSLPIGGPRAPVGKICTEPIDLLLRTVNNRSDILPNYNVVADTIDDQCMDNVAVKTIIPFLSRNVRVSNLSSPEDQIGQYLLPRNFSQSPSDIAYIPPILVGGHCSGVCSVVAKYVPYFDFIEFSAGCNVETLANRRTYPNFYHVMAAGQVFDTFTAFAKALNWTRIGLIISGDATADLTSSSNSRINYLRNSVETLWLEYFLDDPEDAVIRMKTVGARVIFTDCYFADCVKLACQAYKHGLYGANVVWLFSGSMTMINSPYLTPDCTSEMVGHIENGAMFIQVIASDYKSTPIETGMTGAQLDSFLETVVPDLWNDPFKDSRWICYDNVAPAIYILDKAEKTLNSRGSSLLKYISDPSKNEELVELIRNSTESLNIRIFAGRLKYEAGSNDVQVPMGFEQAQRNVRRMVFVDNGAETVEGRSRFEFKAPIVWLTKDGKAPKQTPTIVRQFKQVPLVVIVIFSLLTVLIITAYVGLLLLQVSLRRSRHQSGQRKPSPSTSLMLVAMVFLVSLVLTYPSGGTVVSMNRFCRTAPFIAVVCYSLLSGALITKLTDKTPTKSRNARFRRMAARYQTTTPIRKPSRGVQLLRVMVLLAFSVFLCGMWYALGGGPGTRTIIIVSYDEAADTIWEDVWETCFTDGSIYEQVFGGFVVSLLGGCLLWAMLLAVVKRQHTSPEICMSARCAFVAFPASLAAILVISIAETPATMYYSVSAILFLKSLAVMAIICGTYRKYYDKALHSSFILRSRNSGVVRHGNGRVTATPDTVVASDLTSGSRHFFLRISRALASPFSSHQ